MHYDLEQVVLPDGNVMEYVRRPNGDQPIILIHGYADSWYSFKGVLDYLPQKFAAYAPTLLGHGRSSKPKQAYSIPGYAANVVKFMNLMGIERAAIVGHSMGSFVAQSIALSDPDRVSSLVLIGSAITADNPVLRSVHEEALEFADPVPSDFVWEFQGGTCVGPVDASMSMEDIVKESSQLPTHVWEAAVKGLIDYRPADFDGMALHSLVTPTLVLGGTKDEIFVEDAQRQLADILPNAEILLNPDVGHSPNWEKSERTALQIAEFVGRHR
ncbi:alpha/beta fold hydrolase [Rhizobium sp. L1K21]|uniref:alpha/beta fold hydrolase n=1 Tax=Rhizobium sp. L1K21 TaxID=2954933 RepID=UPI0020931003|nr:alpha/beta fold hydrolase [Rhizobium sp. L1K21]MCO6185161.1 alpha/beta fold hydrolase [Rhizobium sp. L1K21]